MKQQRISILALLVVLLFLVACGPPYIIGTVEGEPITKEEFQTIAMSEIQGNNAAQAQQIQQMINNWRSLKTTFKQYLEMLVLHKEALEQNYDQSDEFQKNIGFLYMQVLRDIILQNDIVNGITIPDDILEKYTTEVQLSQIFIPYYDNDYKRGLARELYRRLQAGEDFATIAQQYTNDPNFKDFGGHVGWIEDSRLMQRADSQLTQATLNLNDGQMTPLIEDENGFHIVKQVASTYLTTDHIRDLYHLYIKSQNYLQEGGGAQDTVINGEPHTRTEAKSIIDDVYNKIQEGADFAELAVNYSEDQESASAGGAIDYLNWLNRRTLAFLFCGVEDDILNMEIGEISGVMESANGFHIFRLEDKKEVTLEMVRNNPNVITAIRRPLVPNKGIEFTLQLIENYSEELKEKGYPGDLNLTTPPSEREMDVVAPEDIQEDLTQPPNYEEISTDVPVQPEQEVWVKLNEEISLPYYHIKNETGLSNDHIAVFMLSTLYGIDQGYTQTASFQDRIESVLREKLAVSYREKLKQEIEEQIKENITEEKLRDFYNNNLEMFSEHVVNQLTYEEAKDQIANLINTREEQALREFYEGHLDQFKEHSSIIHEFDEITLEVQRQYVAQELTKRLEEKTEELFDKYDCEVNEDYFEYQQELEAERGGAYGGALPHEEE